MDAAKSVTATFTQSTYSLAVSVAGGQGGKVTSSPAGIDCGATCSASFNAGIAVTLTATPASGWSFQGWGGACSGTGACSLTMDAAKSVTATFTQITYTLAVSVAGGQGGKVTSSPAGIDCGATCSASFNAGTPVTLTATPVSGWMFQGWSGACSGTGTCGLIMDASKGATATFTQITYTLAVSVAGSQGGKVTSSPAGIDCGAACSASFNSGTAVTLTATPLSGWMFQGWGGACSGTGPCSLTMDAAKSATATLTQITYSLAVSG